MGEARRRKLAGTCPARTQPEQYQPLARDDAIAWAMEVRAGAENETISGVTIFPTDGSGPIYLSADAVKQPPGRRH